MMQGRTKNRVSLLTLWGVLLLVLFHPFVVPLGGKCFEENGRFCPNCPDTPCPEEIHSQSADAKPLVETFTVAESGDGCGDCHYLTFDNVPCKAIHHTAGIDVGSIAVVPALPVFNLFVATIALPVYDATWRLFRRAAKEPTVPRAPPISS